MMSVYCRLWYMVIRTSDDVDMFSQFTSVSELVLLWNIFCRDILKCGFFCRSWWHTGTWTNLRSGLPDFNTKFRPIKYRLIARFHLITYLPYIETGISYHWSRWKTWWRSCRGSRSPPLNSTRPSAPTSTRSTTSRDSRLTSSSGYAPWISQS